jgi:hypothetical protein
MIASHTMLWKNPRAPVTMGANPLLGWQRYEWWSGEHQCFKKYGIAGPLASLAASALDGAIAAARNVTIAQQVENPEASPADLLTAFRRVRPVTLICPERKPRPGTNTRWAMAWLTGDTRKAQPQTLPDAAIQAAVDALAKEQFPPFNQAPSLYAVPSLMLRHDVTAEDLGIVEKQKITPDMILAMVAEDPAVREAGGRWDRASIDTYLPLVLVRLAAQDRLGIPEAQQVLLYSSEVEDYLMPIIIGRLATDAERATELRAKFRRLYGPVYGELVLAFCLKNYPHGAVDGIRQAAGIAA